MAKRKSVCWTICYVLFNPNRPDDEPWTATSFSYGVDASDAKQRFLRYFEEQRENFTDCGDDQIAITNVVRGFSA